MIGDVLKRVRGRHTLDEIALRMGVHKNTLGNYERGERLPEIDFLAAFAAVTGADLGELLVSRLEAGGRAPDGLGRATLRARLAEPPASYRASDAELVSVPTAAGGRASVGMAFERRWLEEQGLDPAALLALTVEDDSMAPTIRQGSLVLVDTRVTQFGGDGLHLIEQGARARVRRLQSDLGGGLFIRCDNPAYRELFLAGEALAGLRMLGRAVWAGGSL